MKIEGYKEPKSSFLSMEKDMGIIVNRLLKNDRLKRLLFYTTNDALNRPNLTEQQSIELIGKNIKMIPKLYVDNKVLNYIIVSFDNYAKSDNPEFRNNLIEIDVICHFDQWELKDFALRPYKIAAEIDSCLANTRLTGIGKLEFLTAAQHCYNNQFGGLCLIYQAVHGEEDKKNMPNPMDQAQFEEDFLNMISGE